MISLLVGLGNIGQRYQKTRHNVGFWVLNRLAIDYKAGLLLRTDEFDKAEISIADANIIMAQPNRFMNNSGYAVKALLQQYALLPSQILVVVDDFNLPLGSIRIKRSGSDGGHNGLASIVEQIETSDFPRMRLGIGGVPEKTSVIDYVLGEFSDEELVIISTMIKTASDAVCTVVTDGFSEAMKKFNKTPA